MRLTIPVVIWVLSIAEATFLVLAPPRGFAWNIAAGVILIIGGLMGTAVLIRDRNRLRRR